MYDPIDTDAEGRLIAPPFTPGPWSVNPVHCSDSDGEYCGTEWWVVGPDREEVALPNEEADAYLISAAPDLLAACRAARKAIEDCIRRPMGVCPESATDACKLIDAALARATGASNV